MNSLVNPIWVLASKHLQTLHSHMNWNKDTLEVGCCREKAESKKANVKIFVFLFFLFFLLHSSLLSPFRFKFVLPFHLLTGLNVYQQNLQRIVLKKFTLFIQFTLISQRISGNIRWLFLLPYLCRPSRPSGAWRLRLWLRLQIVSSSLCSASNTTRWTASSTTSSSTSTSSSLQSSSTSSPPHLFHFPHHTSPPPHPHTNSPPNSLVIIIQHEISQLQFLHILPLPPCPPWEADIVTCSVTFTPVAAAASNVCFCWNIY